MQPRHGNGFQDLQADRLCALLQLGELLLHSPPVKAGGALAVQIGEREGGIALSRGVLLPLRLHLPLGQAALVRPLQRCPLLFRLTGVIRKLLIRPKQGRRSPESQASQQSLQFSGVPQTRNLDLPAVV